MLHGETAAAVDAALRRGLDFIAREQLPGGGFESLSTATRRNFTSAKTYRTTLFPSLIVSALAACTVPQAKAIIGKTADFLLAQKSPGWSFNYWDRSAQEATSQPYPDDLDDTAAALMALQHHNPKLFDGSLTANLAKILIATEQKPGGPYKTWLVDSSAPQQWHDVDIAVNANMAGLLMLLGVQVPAVTTLIEDAIKNGNLRSPYYPDELPVIYFIARWYRGKQVQKLTNSVAQVLSGAHSPLQYGLALNVLLSLNAAERTDLTKAVRQLLVAQAPDGSWPPAAFCIDPALKGKTAYAGSAALTTAVCIEALARYQQLSSDVAVEPAQSPTPDKRYKSVTRMVKQKIAALPAGELKHEAGKLYRRITAQDEDAQIILLPWLVAEAFGREIDARTLRCLAAANVWGWMAYTSFDDFLDAEGMPTALPAAIYCLRNLVATLERLLPEEVLFHEEVDTIMNRLDAANAWEAANCRRTLQGDTLRLGRLPDFGDFSQLADKSLGHTIAAVGTLYAAGETDGSKQLEGLRRFFHHYLIARQLNDDLHDWLDDLRLGQLNAVGTEVLRAWQAQNKRQQINLATETSALQLVMWQTVAPAICKLVLRQTAAAHKALAGLHLHGQKLEELIRRHEAIATETMQKRQETLDFMQGLAD